MPAAAMPAATRRRISASTCAPASGRIRPLRRSVAPADDSRIVPAYAGHVLEHRREGLVLGQRAPDGVEDLDHALDVAIGDAVEVDRRQRRRSASGSTTRGSSPFETEWTVPRDVAHDRPPQADLLDRALDRPELDDVALEVLALGQDQDAHQVVEDDALAGEGERGEDEPEARQHRPQVEDPEDHDDQRDDDGRSAGAWRTGPRASRPADRSPRSARGRRRARPAARASRGPARGGSRGAPSGRRANRTTAAISSGSALSVSHDGRGPADRPAEGSWRDHSTSTGPPRAGGERGVSRRRAP